MTCAPSKELCALWIAKDPMLLHADSEDWPSWMDAQADLSLCWGQWSFCWFCHAPAQIHSQQWLKDWMQFRCNFNHARAWQNQQNDRPHTKDSDQPGYLPSPLWVAKDWELSHTYTKDWSDCADVQVDLSLLDAQVNLPWLSCWFCQAQVHFYYYKSRDT